jgi:hypothetical protein
MCDLTSDYGFNKPSQFHVQVNLIPMDELAIFIYISVVLQELGMFLLAPLLKFVAVEIVV